MLKVTFNGASKTVTGSMYHFEYTEENGSKFNFCVDAGMFQTGEDVDLFEVNANLLFDPRELDCVILTHAHLDHCGRLPYLTKIGFNGKIYSTNATKDLAGIIMRDSATHQGSVKPEIKDSILKKLGLANFPLGKWAKSKNKILYLAQDVEKTIKLFDSYKYHEKIKIHSNLQIEFFDAGHILGSSYVILTEFSTGRKIAFSGDLGNLDKPIIEDPENPRPQENLTHIFVENTYGDRLHGEEKPKDKLKNIARDTFQRGGKLLIPSFSVERSQEIIYHLLELMEEGKIPRKNIYLDSPMAFAANKVFLSYPNLYDKEMTKKLNLHGNPLESPHLTIINSPEESKKLNYNKDSCAIIAGSGMLTGGRILHHIKFHVENPNNTLLFVGFQAEGTLGRKIQEGEINIQVNERDLKVKCSIEMVAEFSSHADQKGLKKWVSELLPRSAFSKQNTPPVIASEVQQSRKNTTNLSSPTRGSAQRAMGSAINVILIHGEENQILAFQKILQEKLPVETIIPSFGEKVVLWE